MFPHNIQHMIAQIADQVLSDTPYSSGTAGVKAFEVIQEVQRVLD